jgi:peptide/nickel transport system substrate-binding protein
MRLGLRAGWLAALLAVLLAGCGGEGARRFSGSQAGDAGGGGDLTYAVGADPGDLDPLHAATVSAQVVTRQIFEPLVESLDGPYGGPQNRPGLATEWEHSGDYRVWSLHLRTGIRFQDDAPLNAEAVVANAERWISDPVGQQLLPGLVAADAPSPNEVRLILAVPDHNLPRRLSDPRLGIVSPPALGSVPGLGAGFTRSQRAGSGPFELQRHAAEVLVLQRYRNWWGSRHGLGPALDSVRFQIVSEPGLRAADLARGVVRVAADLPPPIAARLQRDPLLSAEGAESGHAVGFERSVRGIAGWRPASLAGAWVTLLAEGG